MKLSIFLHFYQPAEQQEDILEMVAAQSYRPVLNGLKNSKGKITLNVTGALLELFDKYNHHNLIQLLKELGASGQIEFTGSAKYHAFLPLIPEEEVIRQIDANDEICRHYLGNSYNPKGFFPPEMGYNQDLCKILEKKGYEWVILDEIAALRSAQYVSGQADSVYKIKGSNLNVYFRDRRVSNMIMSAIIRTKESFLDALRPDIKENKYLIAGMDGETFGHHRPGLETFLFDILNAPELEYLQLSQIPEHFTQIKEVEPIDCTWASSREDIDKNIQFLSWKDPENPIHKLQWDYLYFVVDEVKQLDKNDPAYKTVRGQLDIAMGSDHFWWASAKPWWSAEMVEYGAFTLYETIRQIPNISEEKLNKAKNLYGQIVSTAFNWQRTGKIRKMAKQQNEIVRIPFKERTLEVGGVQKGIWEAFIDMMKNLEKKAAANAEYEKAILWRDAVYKLENKHEIYDTINAIDLLRMELPHEEIEKTLDKYTEQYKKIKGGQPEQRGA